MKVGGLEFTDRISCCKLLTIALLSHSRDHCIFVTSKMAEDLSRSRHRTAERIPHASARYDEMPDPGTLPFPMIKGPNSSCERIQPKAAQPSLTDASEDSL